MPERQDHDRNIIANVRINPCAKSFILCMYDVLARYRMKFMEAEFDRLDNAKTGYLDVRELMQSKLRVSHFSSVGK
jgi:hypothetical protein